MYYVTDTVIQAPLCMVMIGPGYSRYHVKILWDDFMHLLFWQIILYALLLKFAVYSLADSTLHEASLDMVTSW